MQICNNTEWHPEVTREFRQFQKTYLCLLISTLVLLVSGTVLYLHIYYRNASEDMYVKMTNTVNGTLISMDGLTFNCTKKCALLEKGSRYCFHEEENMLMQLNDVVKMYIPYKNQNGVPICNDEKYSIDMRVYYLSAVALVLGSMSLLYFGLNYVRDCIRFKKNDPTIVDNWRAAFTCNVELQ